MNWKVILGRIVAAIPPAAVLIFSIVGYTPKWWEGLIAVVIPFLLWGISKIPDKSGA